MRTHCPGLSIENILADALVRLVMVADGVSEEEMRIVLENARDAVEARGGVRRRENDSDGGNDRIARFARHHA